MHTTFKGCNNLKAVVLPSNVRIVNSSCFADTLINKIVIPGTVEELYSSVFYNCINLEQVIIQEGQATSFKTGKDYIFGGTKVETIALPSRTTYIEGYFYRDSKIKNTYVKATTPPQLILGWGDGAYNLYVPTGCLEVYKAATNWSKFRSIQEYDFVTNPDNVE